MAAREPYPSGTRDQRTTGNSFARRTVLPARLSGVFSDPSSTRRSTCTFTWKWAAEVSAEIRFRPARRQEPWMTPDRDTMVVGDQMRRRTRMRWSSAREHLARKAQAIIICALAAGTVLLDSAQPSPAQENGDSLNRSEERRWREERAKTY